MKGAEPNHQKPCPLGLGVARAAQEAVAPDIVILFGSRARGDHRPDSDIDLLVIHQEDRPHAAMQAQRAGYAELKQQARRGEVNAIGMTREHFDYARRAKNHVSAQALRDGVIMSSEKLDYEPKGEDQYPANWPDIKERLQAASEWLYSFDRMVADPQCSQRVYGFHAQQAVENVLKGWLSAANLNYDRIHDIDELAKPLLEHPAESDTAAADQLRRLLAYAGGDPRTWLTRYAVEYRYEGVRYTMNRIERGQFRERIDQAVLAAIDHIHQITGTGVNDWQ